MLQRNKKMHALLKLLSVLWIIFKHYKFEISFNFNFNFYHKLTLVLLYV